jgi:hypothetical protein
VTAFSPVVESRVRDTRNRAAKREEAAKQAAKQAEQRETRESISPNDLILAEKRRQAWDYWTQVRLANEERDRQEKIREANPVLISLKAEYMLETTTPSRRATLVRQFVELYRKSYGKQVPVETLTQEWDQELKKMRLKKIFGGNNGTGKV